MARQTRLLARQAPDRERGKLLDGLALQYERQALNLHARETLP